MASSSTNSYVLSSGTTSGLTINLHPLPILNVSDHYNRARLTTSEGDSPKLIGALLGTESNREVSIVNSFELIYLTSSETDPDVDMAESSAAGASATAGASIRGGEAGKYALNAEFLETRKEQFKQVFPTLEVVGWYSVGEEPTADDVALHKQFAGTIDTPIFLLFQPDPIPGSQALPIKIYEAALSSEGGTKESENETEGKFVQLEYGIETGEAERIAVDGVSRGGMGGDGEESTVVANLTTQRNAIRMLYERISVLLQYISGVINKTAKPDHTILRQISALVATLPTMDAKEFQEELMTEYSDVQLAAYLTTLTKQLNALSEYADKHNILHPAQTDDFGPAHGGSRGGRGFGGFGGGFGGGLEIGGSGRRRK
ncbi:hypothetical protein CI109_105513 [Kwoniella shandongensis]|uniref:COP9 signalosome complex subunit 6 n=1 Tax=Kwoniella shandongensis TaxID=1734106 RepID=A0AAJ8LNE0_9TREE